MALIDVNAESEEKSDEGTIGSGDVTISYVLKKEDLFDLKIQVSKGGTVYDGEEQIRDGEMTYSLPLEVEKTFKICPDPGYAVERIRYHRPIFEDEKDFPLTEEIINIPIESTDTILEIVFKKEEPVPSKPVDTGDDEDKKDKVDTIIIDNIKVLNSIKVIENTKYIYKNEETIRTLEENSVNTGDTTDNRQQLLILMISLIIIVIIGRRNQKDKRMRREKERWR
ncbi:hypothetical protein MKC73_01995 [[Clostridium] innocuum]|nr:hypothetical protein [[Clostridium] innocuum]